MQGFRCCSRPSASSVFAVEGPERHVPRTLGCPGERRRRCARPSSWSDPLSPLHFQFRHSERFEPKVPIEHPGTRVRTCVQEKFRQEWRVTMQGPTAPTSIARLVYDPSIDDLAYIRARRQQKLIAAIMAHPSYKATDPQGRTTREKEPC